MNVRSLILVVIAITVAGVAALLARNLMSGQSAPAAQAAAVQPAAKMQVLVAAVPLPVGRLIDPKDFRWQSWPDNNVDPTYYMQGQADPASLAGKVVRVGMAVGQPVTQGNLVGPGEQGFLAAILKPGMRAVAVAVTDTSGVAGFIFPGDRVDLVLTQEIDAGEGPSRKAAETVLRNVRVLAIDQSTNDQDNMPRLVRTVTLEVTPQLVEYVSVMGRIGQLSLSLRPLARKDGDKLASAEVQIGPDGKPLPPTSDMIAADAVSDPELPSSAQPTVTMDRDVSKALSMVRYVRGSGAPMPGMSGPPVGMQVTSAPPAAAAAPPPPRPSGGSVTIVRGGQVNAVSAGGEK